ncbi:hypothetical protein ACWKW4_20905 [Hydrogenophaga borbori]
MTQYVTFAGVHIALLEGWIDVTDDLPEGSPPTLAKPEGVGALQFTVATCASGMEPQVTLADLDALLDSFARSRSLGAASDVERGAARSNFVGATDQFGGDLLRAWYASNGSDVALVTYLADAASDRVLAELAEASSIAKSLDFG